MALAELHAWALQRRWGRTRRDQLTRHVGRYVVHYADQRLCERWAELMDEARVRGRPIGAADAWIAATALVQNLPLVTHNPNNYASVALPEDHHRDATMRAGCVWDGARARSVNLVGQRGQCFRLNYPRQDSNLRPPV